MEITVERWRALQREAAIGWARAIDREGSEGGREASGADAAAPQITRHSLTAVPAGGDAARRADERYRLYMQFVAAHGQPHGQLTNLIAGTGMYLCCADYRRRGGLSD